MVAHISHNVSGAVDGLLQQGHGEADAAVNAALCGAGGGVATTAPPAGEDDGVARGGGIAMVESEHGLTT